LIKTKPEEFIKFHNLLIQNAPGGYTPWYFPLIIHNKSPDVRCSWKSEQARLTFEQALTRLNAGMNVGIAARKYDPLVIIDIDEWNYANQMPDTLIIKSRKRCGLHGFCWATNNYQKKNIPTEEYGEVRAVDQYVVAAGSYCETSEKDIDNQNISRELQEEIKRDKDLGVYTIFKVPDKGMFYIDSEKDLPEFFRTRLEEQKEIIKPVEINPIMIKKSDKHSALFDLTINNIISIPPTKREPHPLHNSDTGMNFSVSKGVAHCWRHNVSINALQFLVIKSGYMSCLDAGSGHKGSGAGRSKVVGDKGAIFSAWLEAKRIGLIPIDDPIPYSAMIYVAKNHGVTKKEVKKLSNIEYNKVLKIVKEEY